MTPGSGIHVEGVTVARGGLALLAPVDFTLEPASSLALSGQNGSGKTTLLRVLAGRTPPTTGQVLIGGSPTNERDPRFRARVAALIGLPPLARNLTLTEHLTLIRVSWGATTRDAAAGARRLLSELRLENLGARFPHELSSGQTQLFCLAVTLARPFEVLLLDEPEQRLDEDRLELVTAMLLTLKQSGTTVVIASHHAAMISTVADATLTLREPVAPHEQ